MDFSEFGGQKIKKSRFDFSDLGEVKSEQPKGKESFLLDSISKAIGQTPLGMAAQGTGAAVNALSTPVLNIGKEVGKPLSSVTTRPARALGVLTAEATQFPFQPTNADMMRAGKEAIKAYQPGYEPKTMRQQIGFATGEGAALAGLGLIPGVGPELATAAGMSSNIEKTGGFSLGDIAGAGAIAATNVPRIVNRLGLVEKLLPSLMKSQKGVPLEVTKMALEDPSIIGKTATTASIKDKTQGIIDAFKEARQKVRDEFGKTYLEETGLPNPVDEFIADIPGYKSKLETRNYAAPGTPQYTGVNPNEPMGMGANQSISHTDVSKTVPVNDPALSLDQLKSKYDDVISGRFFAKKNSGTGGFETMGNKEKLAKLTQLKREIQAQADYLPEGQQVGASKGVVNTGIQKMAATIDEIRGKIPGGEKLAVADDAYNEMKAIKNQLQNVLKDTGSQQDYLNRILKGNIDWLTAGRNGQKIEAIKRVEEITGQNVLKPALQQMAIAYIQNPDILSLPSFQTSKFFANFIPNAKILDAGVKFRDLGSNMGGRFKAIAPTSLGLLRRKEDEQ